jgi:hypothetical protein
MSAVQFMRVLLVNWLLGLALAGRYQEEQAGPAIAGLPPGPQL